MSAPRIARRSAVVGACLILAATAVSACSSSGSSHDGTVSGTGTGSAGSGTTSLQAKAAAAIASLYKGISTSPVTSAPKPQHGKKIWIIATGLSIDVAQQATQGAADAAKAIGWSSTTFDGKFQPNVMLQGVQQAIAAKADGIVLYAIDCAIVKTGLEAAKAAHIPVVGIESQDCSPSLESVITYTPRVGDYRKLNSVSAGYAAQYLIATKGVATFIELKETDAQATLLESQGFEAALKADCPACKNVVVPFTGADIGPSLQQKVQQALLQNPSAAGVYAPYDAVITSGVGSAVVSSGRASKLAVISAGGSTPNIDLIREGRGQTADLVYSSRWEGFASIDWMNRLFNGLTPTAGNAATGIGYQLVDTDHGLPESGPVPSTIDFESIYKKAWGV